MCEAMEGKRSHGCGGDSFCVVWFMCVLCALRPCKFISTGPVQQHDLLLFSMSPHNNKVSQTWCLTLIYDPSQKLNFWCPLSLWKRKVSVSETSGINSWWLLLHRSDSDLPLRAFTRLAKLFSKISETSWTKNTFEEKCCSQFDLVWFPHLVMAFCLIQIFAPQASALLVGLRRPLCAWHHQHMPPDANLWLFLLFIICIA